VLAALLILGQDQGYVAPFDLAAKMGYASDERNGYFDYFRGCSIFTGTLEQRDMRVFTYGSSEVEEGTEIKTMTHGEARVMVVSKYAKYWDDIRKGNAKRVFRPGLDDFGFDTLLPDLGAIRPMGRLGTALSESRFAAGDSKGGWEYVLDGYVFASQVSGAGTLINYFVGGANKSAVLMDISKVDPLMPEPSARRAIQVAEWALNRRDMLAGLASEERALGPSLMRMPPQDWRGVVVRSDASDQELADMKSEIPAFIAALKQSDEFYRWLGARPESEWVPAIEDHYEWLRGFKLGEAMMPEISIGVLNEQWTRTQLRLLIAQAKVSLFYWENARFPGSLEEVGMDLVDGYGVGKFEMSLVGKRFEIWYEKGGVKMRIGERSPWEGGAPDKDAVPPATGAGMRNFGILRAF
jgi:hypothetical protein